MQNENNRTGYIDIARILSAFAVVIIHVLSIIVQDADMAVNPTVALTMDVVHRWCNWSIPMFFMITGVLWLGGRRECTYKDMKKHLVKFAIVLVTLGFVYSMIPYIQYGIKAKTLLNGLKNLLMGDAFYHFWYVYTVIGVYLFLPIANVIMNQDKRFVKTVMIITFVAMILRKLPAVEEIMFPITGYTFYLFMGGVFAKRELAKKHFVMALIGAVVSSLIIIWAALNFGVQFNSFVLYGYRTIPAFILALSLLVILRYVLKNYQPGRFVLSVSESTWGIYLIHPLLLHFMTKLGIYPLHYPAAVSVPLACVIVFVLSYAIVWVLRRIKFVRRYFL